MARIDPHSYTDDQQPRVRHLELAWKVDFDSHVLDGHVVLELTSPGSGPLDLDTKGLAIRSARSGDGQDVRFEIGPEEEILGRRLRLHLPANTQRVRVDYMTSPEAIALQWLDPVQTAGKKHPFLFSQCQAIHARTMVPIQDSPSVRVTYRAEVTVPEALGAVMSAGPGGTKQAFPGWRTHMFEMPQPIPSYLLALAVGELASRDLGRRARVWAEPSVVEAAAWEFAEVETMIARAETLFGPYEWDRYDMLVLPPSFPYGGMENPRMTFLTPTLLAGDRSLVDVVCHELAHSWTGNLVTNSTMEHFWLNEGWTVYAERRILEALKGEEAAILAWAIGQNALDESMTRFTTQPELTKLHQHLQGVDPDDAFSSIPYEKGSRFLVLCERTAGRDRFDQFVRDYIGRFRFTSITSQDFIAFLDERLPGISARVDARRWLEEPGLPDNAPVFRSAALDRLVTRAKGFANGERPGADEIRAWTPTELLIYLQNLPRELDAASCEWLDRTFELTKRGNYEILVEWLTIAGGSDYEPAFDRIRSVLSQVGRMKYLRPLYAALNRHPRTLALGRAIFGAASPTYHALSRRVVEGVLAAPTPGGS